MATAEPVEPVSRVSPEVRAHALGLLRSSVSPGQRFREGLIEKFLLLCGLFSILITVAIVLVILFGSFEFFTHDEHRDYNQVFILTKERAPERALRLSAASVGMLGAPLGSGPLLAAAPHAIGTEKRDRYDWMTVGDILQRIGYFFTGTEWTGNIAPHKYGILPLLVGTLMVAIIAGLIALPIGLTIAIYLSEYAAPRVRAIAKPVLELLAGIPTVVYGYFAITVITPFLAGVIPGVDNNNNMLSGGIVVAIMIIPMVASLSEDALRAVPRNLRDGAYALGANKFETSVKVVLPSALSGVFASFILAISRAIGETMAVTLACGSRSVLNFDPREGSATMTSFIAQVAQGDTPRDTSVFNSLFAVAGVLFFMTLGMNVLAQKVLKRYRQVYQ